MVQETLSLLQNNNKEKLSQPLLRLRYVKGHFYSISDNKNISALGNTISFDFSFAVTKHFCNLNLVLKEIQFPLNCRVFLILLKDNLMALMILRKILSFDTWVTWAVWHLS